MRQEAYTSQSKYCARQNSALHVFEDHHSHILSDILFRAGPSRERTWLVVEEPLASPTLPATLSTL